MITYSIGIGTNGCKIDSQDELSFFGSGQKRFGKNGKYDLKKGQGDG